MKSLDEVRSDIDKAAELLSGHSKTLFIGDSNSVVMKELPRVLRYICKKFDGVERITSYARAKSFGRLGLDRTKELREAGLDRVHIGLESGDDQVLEMLSKGATAEDMIRGALIAKEAGLEVSEYVLLGAGGKERYREHAANTARVLNSIPPDFIRFRTLTIQPGTPLWEMKERGDFQPVSPKERLEETRLILSDLKMERTEVVSDHVTNNLWFDRRLIYRGVGGTLPNDMETMIGAIKKTMDLLESSEGEIWDTNHMLERGYLVGL